MLTIGYSVRRGSAVSPSPYRSLLQVLIAQPDEALCASPCAVLVFWQQEGEWQGQHERELSVARGV